jgi:hypothetical protein
MTFKKINLLSPVITQSLRWALLVLLLLVIGSAHTMTIEPPSVRAQSYTTTMTPVALYLPMMFNDYKLLADRLGYGVTGQTLTHYPDLGVLNAGWYLDWSTRAQPARPYGMEYVQTIRIHQQLACGQRYHGDRNACPYAESLAYVYYPNAATITQTAQANPGSLWLIGNEMDRKDWSYCAEWDGDFCRIVAHSGQDELLPESYAAAFHELATLVRSADPTARIAIGGVIQATPLRLQYLTRVWDSYQAQYSAPMPVDVWNVHNFILQEQRNNWGAEIPPGIEAEQGEYLGNTRLHLDMSSFDRQIRAFRQWMKERDQQDKPLVVSEYGVLYHNNTMGIADGNAAPVQNFMLQSFDYFLHTKDCNLGFAADDCRLVQRWNWYSLDDRPGDFNPHSRLMDPTTLQITGTGLLFSQYTTANLSLLAPRGYAE